MLRLLYISHSFPPLERPLANMGGMQRVATELYAALAAHPEVHLSSIILRSSWRLLHLRIVPFWLKLLREIPERVEREKIDVVLFSSMVPAFVAVRLRKKLEARGVLLAAIPLGLDVTSHVPGYQRLLPHLFDSLDLLLPISRATAEECAVRGVPEEKLHIVPCGVNPNRFPPLGDRAEMRQELMTALGESGSPLPADALLLCGVGRHVKRKGFAWFTENVMPQLPDNVHFWLAGDGPQTPEVRAAIAQHGLENRVRLLGRISDEKLLALYRGADLFVMPNIPVPGDMEGFGVVMLEAGFCGLPSVAAGIEGILDVVQEGENGVLVPSGDAPAFARAILRYHNDRDALAADSARAAVFTANTFAWSAVADQYVQVLRSAALSPAAHSSEEPYFHLWRRTG